MVDINIIELLFERFDKGLRELNAKYEKLSKAYLEHTRKKQRQDLQKKISQFYKTILTI